MAFTSEEKGTKRNPRDPRNRHNVHPNPGGGGNPLSVPYPPLQAPGGGGMIDQGVLSAAANSVIDLQGEVDTDEEDDDAVASSYWTTARNPLLAMEAIAREQNGEDNDGGKLSDALVKSAIAHRLKRNTSSRDLSFTPQQLEDLLDSLTENRRELLEFAIRADSHRPSNAVQLASQLGEAIPVKFSKKLKKKEGMADRLAEIYFIWREVARCPQVTNSLPHVRTKLGSALEGFTLSLVRVHTICMAELEMERNTAKALRSEKISGKFFSVLAFCFNHLFVTRLCILTFFSKTLR